MDLSKFEFKIRDKFTFYYVDDAYVEYLKNYDCNVCDNYAGKRAYIGIIIEVNGHDYLAPLTSPDKQYLKNKKYKRIVHPINNSDNGWVRIGNMIPVTKDVVVPVIIPEITDEYYKGILLEQYMYLRKDYVINIIREQAKKLYDKRYNNDNYYLSGIICNYKILEEKCKNYKNIK